MADMDDAQFHALQQFLEATGAEPNEAIELLGTLGWDLELAVHTFFEGHVAPRAQSKPSRRRTSARRISALSDPIKAEEVVEEGVRAPIPQKEEVLYGAGHPSSFRSSKADVPMSTQEAFRDFERERTRGDTSTRRRGLAELFKPPIDLMFLGGFDEARYVAKEQQRWLLVNVQKADEFDSQRLNRDTWSHDALRDVIQGNFTFWQQYNDSEEGTRFCSFYNVYQFPFCCVIDPRTGQKLAEWVNYVEPPRIIGDLVAFLSSHSLNSFSAKKTKTSGEITETEELAAAIAASLEEATSAEKRDQALTYDDLWDIDEEEGVAEVDPERRSPDKETCLPSSKEKPVDVEPSAQDPLATRIQVRFPDGTRFARRFFRHSTIQHVHDYIKFISREAKERPFHLFSAFPRCELVGMTSTLENLGVCESVVVVEWDVCHA